MLVNSPRQRTIVCGNIVDTFDCNIRWSSYRVTRKGVQKPCACAGFCAMFLRLALCKRQDQTRRNEPWQDKSQDRPKTSRGENQITQKTSGTWNLKVAVLAQQQVLRLEVAVRHRQMVQVLQRENDAPAEERRHRQRETSQTALRDWRVPFVDVRPVVVETTSTKRTQNERIKR